MKKVTLRRRTPLKTLKITRRTPKPRKPKQGVLKKKLDTVFSLYIRLKYADVNGYVSCYTCGVRKHYKQIQCGHFVSRIYLATRYDERNCRPQCAGCNLFGNGKPAEFAQKLEAETPGIVNELYKKAREIIKDFPYQELIDKYSKLQ